jgi:hypothetical protein
MKKEKIKLPDVRSIKEVRDVPQRKSQHERIEEFDKKGAEVMSKFLDIQLSKQKRDICGKQKSFDLVNVEHRVVGDVKNLDPNYKQGDVSNMCEYVWLMEKLEKYTRRKWRKMIVGFGNRKIFADYARLYDSWLSDVEIYFIDDEKKVHRIRPREDKKGIDK